MKYNGHEHGIPFKYKILLRLKDFATLKIMKIVLISLASKP